MKKLLVYMKPYIKESIFGPLFKLFEATLDLIVPIVIAKIIDDGIAASNMNYIMQMCAMLVGIAIVGLLFSVTAQYFSAKAAVGFTSKMRSALFAHIGTLSYSELDKTGTSTLITRMTSDMNQVQSGTNLTLRLLLRSPFVVIGAAVMAYSINSHMSLIFLATIAVLSVVVFGIMLRSIPLYKSVQTKLDNITLSTRENLTGVRVIRAFCKEDEEIEKFEQRNNALTSMQKFAGRVSALMNPMTYIVINLAVIWLIHLGAIKINAGDMTSGEVVALYNYTSQILVELVKLANLIVSVTKAVACANRIQSVFEIEPGQSFPTSEPENKNTPYAVEFKNVSLAYNDKGETALSDIDFKVKKGETVGIIGGTGSGKTSLVNLISRFYDATSGEVLIDGNDVKNYSEKTLREKIGVVPQKAVLFSGSIRDNIKWGKIDASDDEINLALKAAQASEIVKQKDGGLDYEIEQRGGNLSGGQKQRFTIARALVKKPEILILDDSASALDFATDAALRKAISELPWKPVTFIVSQRASSVRYADKIIVLDDGNIAGIGTHDELMETSGVYREIFESQYKKEETK